MSQNKNSADCLFCRILNGELPSAKVYEDEHVYAFLDIAPCSKGHTLVVPKVHSRNLLDFNPHDAANLTIAIQKIAKALIEVLPAQGFHIMQNNEPAALQTVFHSHWHIIPRSDNDDVDFLKKIPYEPPEAMQDLAQQITKTIEKNT